MKKTPLLQRARLWSIKAGGERMMCRIGTPIGTADLDQFFVNKTEKYRINTRDTTVIIRACAGRCFNEIAPLDTVD